MKSFGACVVTCVLFLAFVLPGCRETRDPVERVLESPDFIDALREHLEENLASPGFSGEMFCAYEVFGGEPRGDTAVVYLWAECIEYYVEDGELKMGTGISLPLVLSVLPEDTGYSFVACAVPENGEQYAESVRRIFPKEYLGKILPETPQEVERYDARAAGLMHSTEKMARAHYGLD